MNKYNPKVTNYRKPGRKLVMWSAMLIFLSYLASQLLAGLIGGIALSIIYNVNDQELLQDIIKQNTISILIFSLAFSFSVMLVLSLYFCRGLFRDRSPTGIAIHSGGFVNTGFGILLGLIVSMFYLSIALFVFPPGSETEVGPLTEMLMKPGKTRIAWLFFALFFAPAVEEFLFRGVLFAGINYSRGIVSAAVITSILFISIHIFEAIHYPPAFIGISLIAVATLYLRLKFNALGPAVGAHFGYNLLIAAGALVQLNQ